MEGRCYGGKPETGDVSQTETLWLTRRGWLWGIAIAIVVGLASTKAALLALGMLGAVLLAIVFYYRPYWGYVIVVVAATLTHFRFASPIGHWRLEQVASTFGLLGYLRLRSGPGLFRFDLLTRLLLAWIGINAVASLFAPEVFSSEKIVVWLLTDLFAFIFAREIVRHYGLIKAFIPFWIAGIAAVSLGIGMFAMHPHAHQGRAMGLMQEPDVFGTFSAVLVVYGLSFLGQSKASPWLDRTRHLGIVVGATGLLLSGTRSSLFGLLIALALGLVFERRWLGKVLPASLVVAALAGMLLHKVILARLTRVSTASTLAYRMIRVKIALAGIRNSWHHLVLGHGTNAYGQFHLTLSSSGIVPDYLAVQIVTVPYDTGLVGSVAFIAWMIVALRTMWENRNTGALAKGSLYAFLAMMVAYQATNGIWFGFTWLVLALGCGASVQPRASSRLSTAGSV